MTCRSPVLALVALFTLAGCGDANTPPAQRGPAPDLGVPQEHRDETAVHHQHGKHGGHVKPIQPGVASAEIVLDKAEGRLNVWLLDGASQPLAVKVAPRLGLEGEGDPVTVTGVAGDGTGAWTFEHEALREGPDVQLVVTIGSTEYDVAFDAGSFDDSGHGAGVVAPLVDANGTEVGHIELKLHDDLGDLELWITKGDDGKWPMDLPLATTIEVHIGEGASAKTVLLHVRDKDTNPDEAGKATIRNGKTNYFIFPGETGADASWLTGEDFKAPAVVKIPHPTGTMTATLTLVPHKH